VGCYNYGPLVEYGSVPAVRVLAAARQGAL